ncbi:MAG: ribbon-helix-helix domain-containing protein [Myxococcales bacterium]
MRTTLTLDDDVAALLRELQRKTRRSPKELINGALREGLRRLERASQRPRARHELQPFDAGRCLLPSLDCTAEVLAQVEGESFK